MNAQMDYEGFEVLAVHTKLYSDHLVEIAKPNPKYNPNSNLSDSLIVKRIGASRILSDFSKLEDALIKLALGRLDRKTGSNFVPEISQTEIELSKQYDALKKIAPYVRTMTQTNIQPRFCFN